ncbi:hypothetical protein TSOC_005187 [Tetrabaena socialis]|uniref:THIF-type NAD/FAD binding fold domain-containing protein n=1 Tax=Tetrabaena socialis TaxID=47790 RepID=A0A2J8A706_9CHLO|nr:hypothetical protein TSOC_005187 [Tetrabaena socialis]|eukprot:PNH08280.1 hypothetical protein TSOC_005187 [Tetrabaena socialis]
MLTASPSAGRAIAVRRRAHPRQGRPAAAVASIATPHLTTGGPACGSLLRRLGRGVHAGLAAAAAGGGPVERARRSTRTAATPAAPAAAAAVASAAVALGAANGAPPGCGGVLELRPAGRAAAARPPPTPSSRLSLAPGTAAPIIRGGGILHAIASPAEFSQRTASAEPGSAGQEVAAPAHSGGGGGDSTDAGGSGGSSSSSSSGRIDAAAGALLSPGSGGSPCGADLPEWLERTTLLLGAEGMERLQAARVVVVGLGGVGSYVVEFLLPALDSTVGLPKVAVISARLLDINPHLNLVVRQEFMEPDEACGVMLAGLAAELQRGARGRSTSGSGGGSGSGSSSSSSSGGGNGAGNSGSSSSGSNGGSSSDAAAGSGGGGGRDDAAAAGSGSGGGGGGAGVSGRHSAEGGSRSGGVGGGGGRRGGAGVGPLPLDWVVDCIDSIAPKVALVAAARSAGAQVVSSMGAGGRMDPLSVHVADLSETFFDPFAANVRRGLRREYGIREGVTVVFSTEPSRRSSLALAAPGRFKRSYYGTISYLPAIFGLQIAAHLLNAITDGPMMASEAAQRAELRRRRDALTGSKGGAAEGSSSGSGSGRGGGNTRRRRRARAEAAAQAAALGAGAAGDAVQEAGRGGGAGGSEGGVGGGGSSGGGGRGSSGQQRQGLAEAAAESRALAVAAPVAPSANVARCTDEDLGMMGAAVAGARPPGACTLAEAAWGGSGLEGGGI